jgi:hypothetical protein
MNPAKGENNHKFLKRVADELGEHFDCVQIFAQIDTPESTTPFSAGIGNIFARVKQAEIFVERFDEIQFIVDFREKEEDEEE